MDQRGRHSALVLLTFALAAMLCGCKSKQAVETRTPPSPAPSYEEIARVQNERIAKFQPFFAEGTVQIHWQDDRGNHGADGDINLWVQLPRRTALRVSKVGEELLWIGSDEQHYWVFEMTGKEKVLYVGAHDEPVRIADSGFLGIRPLALLDLMGLTPLPTALPNPPQVEYDAKTDAWVVQVSGAGGAMRFFMDRKAMLPVRVETLDASGQVAFFSKLWLHRYDSVKLRGVSPAAFPKMPMLVDVASPEGRRGGEFKLALNQAVGADSDQLQRVFDLNRLIKRFPPDRVEGEIPETALKSATTR